MWCCIFAKLLRWCAQESVQRVRIHGSLLRTHSSIVSSIRTQRHKKAGEALKVSQRRHSTTMESCTESEQNTTLWGLLWEQQQQKHEQQDNPLLYKKNFRCPANSSDTKTDENTSCPLALSEFLIAEHSLLRHRKTYIPALLISQPEAPIACSLALYYIFISRLHFLPLLSRPPTSVLLPTTPMQVAKSKTTKPEFVSIHTSTFSTQEDSASATLHDTSSLLASQHVAASTQEDSASAILHDASSLLALYHQCSVLSSKQTRDTRVEILVFDC